MAKIQVVNPLPMQWEPSYLELLGGNGNKVRLVRDMKTETLWGADLTVFMWADAATGVALQALGKKLGKVIVFLRRYEYYSFPLEEYAWETVDAVVCVNDFLAAAFEERTRVKPEVIYNAVDTSKWACRRRDGSGKKIAMVGFVNARKNLPLAMQIMQALPKDYELHVAGGMQCLETGDYLMNYADREEIKLALHGNIDDIDAWLEDKEYLLNTSISEGCPNSVLEAMAKGIKPVVHAWPGALEQFGGLVFSDIGGAVEAITGDSPYESDGYLRMVEDRFGRRNYERFTGLLKGVLSAG